MKKDGGFNATSQKEAEITQKILGLLEKHTGHQAQKIALEADLHDTLGLSGDDADAFMVEYFKEFGIDYSKYNVNEYFAAESGWQLFRQVFNQKFKGYKHLNTKMLINIAALGKWP